jgi:fucose 4-O-acetylase-like acetyltransferase
MSTERLGWVDYAKGIAIFLIVVGHSLTAMINSGLMEPSIAINTIIHWVYVFHVPVFFFTAGVFAKGAASRPFTVFLNEKIRAIVYPYLVWATLQMLAQATLSRYSNHQYGYSDLLRIPYLPPMQFWFLYTLFGILCLHWASVRTGMGPRAFLAASLVIYVINVLDLYATWGVLHMMAASTVYFAVGVLLADTGIFTIWKAVKTGTLAGVGILGYACVSCILWLHLNESYALKPLAAVSGIAATVAFAMILERFHRAQFVQTWGLRSLEIYVAHVLASAVARILLQRFLGVELGALHIVLSIVCGIYGPIALYRLCQLVGFSYMFSLRRAPLGSGQEVARCL